MTEPEPPRGVPLDVLPEIRRIVARNASVMTYQGTNTYLITNTSGLTVLDPGPDDAQHVEDILRACGAVAIARIVVTHAHSDHYGAVAALAGATGAPVYAHRKSPREKLSPTHLLDDGDEIAGLKAVFTPGHAADHLCFEYFVSGYGKILFSGDHVMSWSSSIVSPPDGDMLDYYRSLELLLRRDEIAYLPGHGPVLPEPRLLVAELLAHRQMREATILEELRHGPADVSTLAEKLYHKIDLWLRMAARQNVIAHLLKLQAENIVVELEPGEATAETMALLKSVQARLVNEESGGGDVTEKIKRLNLRRFALRPTG